MSRRRRSIRAAGYAWLIAAVLTGNAVFTGVTSLSTLGNAEASAKEPSPVAATPIQDAQDAAQLDSAFQGEIRPLFAAYCADCHSGEYAEAGIDLLGVDSLAAVGEKPRQFESILKMVKATAMPPADATTLPQEDRARLVEWLDAALDHAAAQLPPEVDRPTIRRLNRAEYDNTIRDLFGIDFSAAEDFPSDEVGYGFDNIGDVLSVSTLHLEKYLSAAERIAERAIDAEAYEPFRREFAATDFQTDAQGAAVDDRGSFHMSRNGEAYVEVQIPTTAEYRIAVEATADQAGDEPAKVEIRALDNALGVFDVASRRRASTHDAATRLPKGKTKIAAAFINDFYDPDAERNKDRNLQVRRIVIERIGEPDTDSLPAAHRRIISQRPTDEAEALSMAEEAILPVLERAFRRPVSNDEVARYAVFVERAARDGLSFERGMQIAISAILVSPHFLFHIEGEPPRLGEGANADAEAAFNQETLANFAVASRLSYFLWSSMPDEELFALARAGQLRDENVLKQQVQRMLADERGSALVANFAGQWLNLRRLDEIAPTDESIPGLDAELKTAMRMETEHLFAWVMKGNRPITDLLDAEITFVNARLAKHYGLPDANGDDPSADAFRQVSLEGTGRAGILSHASILTLTSNPTRTSPVKRGKWILENLLADPPPEPPADVPPLEEAAEIDPDATLREQLSIHRQDATCNSCHQVMDELGFGFEDFGPLGQVRGKDERGRDVDSSGVLPSGERFDGAAELISLLKSSRSRDFARCFAEKMFTYATGRGATRRDRPVLDAIVDTAKADDFRFHTIVTEIVLTDTFREPGSSDH